MFIAFFQEAARLQYVANLAKFPANWIAARTYFNFCRFFITLAMHQISAEKAGLVRKGNKV